MPEVPYPGKHHGLTLEIAATPLADMADAETLKRLNPPTASPSRTAMIFNWFFVRISRRSVKLAPEDTFTAVSFLKVL